MSHIFAVPTYFNLAHLDSHLHRLDVSGVFSATFTRQRTWKPSTLPHVSEQSLYRDKRHFCYDCRPGSNIHCICWWSAAAFNRHRITFSLPGIVEKERNCATQLHHIQVTANISFYVGDQFIQLDTATLFEHDPSVQPAFSLTHA